jgi:uracil-DNA glycosylase
MNNKVKIEKSWHDLLKDEFKKPYFEIMRKFIRAEYKQETVFPEAKNIFNAFNSTPVDRVKCVIIGQDPYHGKGQAHGLCFSVNPGVKIPPSLKNIYKEIENDLGVSMPQNGYLQQWANQGVLMLNNVLTVREGKPNSHKSSGWEIFTSKVIENLSKSVEDIVFILWGNSAQQKEALIKSDKHLILKAPHPSPLSAYSGYFGCKHFSKTNRYLISKNKEKINWTLVG